MRFKQTGDYGSNNINQAPRPVKAGDAFHSTADAHKIDSKTGGGSSEQKTGPMNVTPAKLFKMRTLKKIKRLKAIRTE